MHWRLKLALALYLVPLVVGSVWSLAARTPVPFVGALVLVGIVLDAPLRALRRSSHEDSD